MQSLERMLRESRIIPVNPAVHEVLGERRYPGLASVPGPIDILDVFRCPEAAASVAAEAVPAGARVLRLQPGVVGEAAARVAREGGLEVVMDRCTMAEHRRRLGP